MKINKLTFVIIFLITLSGALFAAEYNLIAGEPLALFNNTFSGYYSKISSRNRSYVTFPLSYHEGSNVKTLHTGIEYRKFVTNDLRGIYFETNGYVTLQDNSNDPDVFILTPAFVVGSRIDTGQGLFVEPELVYTLPIASKDGSALEVAQNFDSSFSIMLGIDNVYPNGMFFAPRLKFSYADGTLQAHGKLFIGYGF